MRWTGQEKTSTSKETFFSFLNVFLFWGFLVVWGFLGSGGKDGEQAHFQISISRKTSVRRGLLTFQSTSCIYHDLPVFIS